MSGARAPGKLVLSGAYAVLEGAPAIVAAVSRYVYANAARGADFVTPEVRAALGARGAPWFDASELRRGDQKLGLGSSAAILVASLAALELASDADLSDSELGRAVLERALVAHRQAQGGGSGVDVVASVHGGVLAITRSPRGIEERQVLLPRDLCFEVWVGARAASSSEFLASMRRLSESEPPAYAELMAAQAQASEAALVAVDCASGAALVQAILLQSRALAALGDAAGVPVVTPEARELAQVAEREEAAFLPAGAGGGDVAYFIGPARASSGFNERARALGLEPLELSLGARGVHAHDRVE